jgi:exodeoxyribonuclease III
MLLRMKILSWNVNGIRAAQKKGFLDWLARESPDILCVQETKAHPDQLDLDLLNPKGYHVCWNWSVAKKGYSGVATFTKKKPVQIKKEFGMECYDCEGRMLITEFPEFVLFNIYFPNGGRGPERVKYKLDFYEETMRLVQSYKAKGTPVIISGDYNTAHQPIDLARPKENETTSGFLPEERAWLDKWIAGGQVDIFRKFNQEPHQYTWWDMKSRARDRNIGWRIDYHFVTQDLVPSVKNATIHMEIEGSDHCPIGLELKV